MPHIRLMTAPGPEAQPLERAPVQQPSVSYVNFHATRSEFERVIARLAATSHLPPATAFSASTPSTADTSPSPPSASIPMQYLTGLLSGLLNSNSNGNSNPSSDSPGAALGRDDGSPLSRAVVMFTATWCGPCSVVHKELKQAVRRLEGRPGFAVIVVDVEANKELASELGVKALPTLLYLGRDAARGPIYTQGPVSASAILDTLDRAASFGGRDVAARWLKL